MNKTLLWSLLALLISLSKIFDVEPLFDQTDLNLILVLSLIASAGSIILDNLYRSLYGQNVEDDVSLYLYALTYSSNLLLYFIVIWAFFFLHYLTPLSTYNVTENFFYNGTITFTLKAMVAVLVLTLTIESTLSSNSRESIDLKLLFFFFVIIMLSITGSIVFSLFFTISSFKSTLATDGGYYLSRNQAALSYYAEGEPLAFDWHLANTNTFYMGWGGLSSSLNIILLLTLITTAWLVTLIIILAAVFAIDSKSSGEQRLLRLSLTLTLTSSLTLLTYCISSHAYLYLGHLYGHYLGNVY